MNLTGLKNIKCARLFIFGFSFLTVAFAKAQLNPANLTQYTELDGVPGAQVSKVIADKFGYVWIGTINGLARYDGYEFKRYINDPNDSTSIKGLVVWGLHEDRKGQVWVASSLEFLNVYNPATKSFRHYEYEHLIDHPANLEIGIYSFGEDDQGRIYFGVTAAFGTEITTGLLYLDETDDTIKRFEAPDKQPIHNVYSIINDNFENIWILSYSGLFKIDSKRNFSKIIALENSMEKNDEFPADLKSTKDGHIWIITDRSGLYDFDSSDESYIVYTPDTYSDSYRSLNKMAMDNNDNVWMGTGRGLLLFNVHTKSFEFFNNESDRHLENSSVQDLEFDSFGTLWIGTDLQGLLKYEEKAILKSYSFDKDNSSGSITPGWVNNIIETHDKKIWITSSGSGPGSGLSVLDLQTNSFSPIPFHSFLPGVFNTTGITEASPGEFLLSTNLGSYRYFAKTNTATRIKLEGVPDNLLINQFYNDRQGNLWLCTIDGLYKKQESTENFLRYDLSIIENGDAVSNVITRVFESEKHSLWILTDNGLFLYDYATDKLNRHGFDKSAGDIFFSQDVNSFYEQPDGTVWVGTWQGGLSRYNVESGKIKTYTRSDGLPSMSIQGILADEKNQILWLSTFDGLSRFDILTGQCNNYSIADGIQGQLFADGSHLKTSDGYFIFGGSNGITVFKPDDINKNSIPPKVFLTDLKIFNKSIIPGENSVLKQPIYDTREIVLSHDQNNISIEFIAIHYSNSSKNKFSYQLENYDNEWREGRNQQDAFYPNLPPGAYVFRVKAANNNDVWNENGATLSITVTPPWWKTIWAYLAYALLFIVGVFGADRFFRLRLIRKERNMARDRELAQAKEIEKAYYKLEQTHEALKATQSQLIQSEKMASLGELTAGIAHEIQNPLNFVNNFSEVNTELIDELKAERTKGKAERDEILEEELLKDIAKNTEKIQHHGKRASLIVKGMLQHSRSSSGQKEPTDINALADEYLRLSYHGLRAKDKSFNADFKTDFDANLPKVHVVPQDIGRVLLNLINNAFYAVDKKAKAGIAGYKPEVKVITRFSPSGGGKGLSVGQAGEDHIRIQVSDNGPGIPDAIVNKIFQPFFTTKPTGQGTGLGLSLSYDIVKSHGGELTLETKEGEGSEFAIILPT